MPQANDPTGTFEPDQSSRPDISPDETPADLAAKVDALSARLDDLETRGGVFHDVRRHGAVGDGVTDDTAAVEAACKAAGNHGVVFFGRGRFLITRTIVVPNDQQWQGVGISDTRSDSNQASPAIVTRVSEGPAIDATYNTAFRSLRFEGDGTGLGMRARGRVLLDNVNLQRYDLAIDCVELWYGHFSALRLYRNRVGMHIDRCYNVNLVAPRINCVDPDGQAAVGLELADNVDVKVFGGAIEGYKVGIQAAHHDSIHLHSVYFESTPPNPVVGPGVGAVAVQLSGTRSTTVTALGCYVYLNNQLVWIDASGADTTASIVAMGNVFKGGNPPADGLDHLAYRWTNGAPLRASISGDQWNQVDYKGNASYLAPDTAVPVGSEVKPPPGSMAATLGRVVNQTRERVRPIGSAVARMVRRLLGR